MVEKSLRLQSMVVHPLIAVVVPSLFVLTLHGMIRGYFGVPARFPDALIALGPAASLVEVVAGNAARKYRAAAHWRIREIALCLLAVLALFIAVSAPLAHYAYLAVAMVLSWATSYAIHAGLRSREDLLRATEGATGPDISRALHEALLLEEDALRRVHAVRRLARALNGVLLVAAVARVFSGGRLGGVVGALLILQAVTLSVVTGVLNAFAGEQRLLARNMRTPRTLRASRSAHGLMLLVISMAAALALARSRALLDVQRAVSLIGRVGAFIAAHRPRLGPRVLGLVMRIVSWIARLFPTSRVSPDPEYFPLSPPAGGGTSELARRLLFAIGMTAVLAGVSLAIAFLLSPLVETEFQEGLRRKHPLSFLLRRLRLLGGLGRGLARRIQAALEDLTDQIGGFSRAPTRVRASSPRRARGAAAPGRARPRGLWSARFRARRQFRLLVLWCARHGVEHRASLGPLELALEAGRRLPGHARELEESAALVELILYSSHPAGHAELEALGRSVRAVTRGR